MKFLLPIIITASLFAQQDKEYNIENIYLRELDKVFIKKFSDEVVNGNIYKMFGDQKVVLGKMVKGKKEGVWSDWYDNGIKQYQGSYTKGIANGKATAYYENGSLQKEGFYRNNRIIGTLKSYFKNGEIETIGKYRVDGQGYYMKDWNIDGSLKLFLELDSLSLDGKSTEYHSNGGIKEVQYFKNGIKNGIDTLFYEDGSIESTTEWVNEEKIKQEKFWGVSAYSIAKFKDGEMVSYRTNRDSLYFIEDSLLVYTIIKKGYTNGYSGDDFLIRDTGAIYNFINTDEVIEKRMNLNGFKVFPIRRSVGRKEWAVLTNLENETIGYIDKSQWKLKRINMGRRFDEDYDFLSKKYGRDKTVFSVGVPKNF